MAEALTSHTVSTKRQRIADLARQHPTMALTNLAHVIDKDWLREAYRLTRKDGAVGVDRVTAAEYAAELEGNLERLLHRMRDGSYRAPPVRRVHIPKAGKHETRPIGIPTFEDKLLQRAVTMVLEAVYEQDFLDCSYGFRRSRSPHQAVEVVWKTLMSMGGGVVLEVDIQRFFEELEHVHLREILDQRIRDKGLRRMIGKWLNAGVLEDGAISHRRKGTPQGGVISPMLANIYLHEVIDTWFEREVRPRLRGRGQLVRFADDLVFIFSMSEDARRVHAVLPKRLGRFGLRLHPAKSRLVEFRPKRNGPKGPSDSSGPGTFSFLGFTHYWGKSRTGAPAVKRKTQKDRLARSLKEIHRWCRRARHWPVAEQHRTLSQKMRGHYAYFGVTGNSRALTRFAHQVARIWRSWLDRRSRRAGMTWERMRRLLQRYPLPPPRIVHSRLRPA